MSDVPWNMPLSSSPGGEDRRCSAEFTHRHGDMILLTARSCAHTAACAVCTVAVTVAVSATVRALRRNHHTLHLFLVRRALHGRGQRSRRFYNQLVARTRTGYTAIHMIALCTLHAHGRIAHARRCISAPAGLSTLVVARERHATHTLTFGDGGYFTHCH